METKEILDKLVEKLEKQAGSKLVFGDVIEKGDKTIIPVAKITSGIGSFKGWLSKIPFLSGEQADEETENEVSGGSVKIVPVGIIEISETETKFVPITDFKKTAAVFALGALFGLLFLRKRKKK